MTSIEEQKDIQHLKDLTEVFVEYPGLSAADAEGVVKLKKAKRAIEFSDKLQTISRQKRLMDAYYIDPPMPALSERLNRLSKPVRAVIVALVSWTAYVIYRTDDDHSLLGIYLDSWSQSAFLSNLLIPPTLIGAGYVAWRWISGKPLRRKKEPTPTEVFAAEIQTWPKEEGELALRILKLLVEQNHKAVNGLLPEISDERLTRIIEYVKVMPKGPLKSKKT
jgi:hypothetical protein